LKSINSLIQNTSCYAIAESQRDVEESKEVIIDRAAENEVARKFNVSVTVM